MTPKPDSPATEYELGPNLRLRAESNGMLWIGFNPEFKGEPSQSGKTVVVSTTHGFLRLPTPHMLSASLNVTRSAKAGAVRVIQPDAGEA